MYIGQSNRRRYLPSRQTFDHHGMSTIEIVLHNDESYVLKLCDTSNPKSTERFPIELDIHSSLHHLQIGQDGIVPFVEPIQKNQGFVMHFIEYGADLMDWYDLKVEEYKTNPRHPNEEPFDLALQLLWRLTRLICMLHDHNIIHNDIKPANFLICDTPTDFRIYVLDFGIARRKHEKLNANGGTLGYTAPECFLNMNDADESSDIFSVIVSWLSALFPDLEFENVESTQQWSAFIQNLQLPQHPILFPALRNLLESMLKPQNQRRHRSSRSFFNALSDCLFFGTKQFSYLERIPSKNNPNRLLGWHDHIINKTDIPTFLSRANLPKFHSTIHGIACLHFASVTTDIEWINPIHSGSTFVKSTHRLGGNVIAPWKGAQKGAFVDVYPKNHSAYPSERVQFPIEQVPQKIQTYPIVRQHGHILMWYGVECSAQTHIQLYSFVQPRILHRFPSRNGQLQQPVPITNNGMGTIYIVWDSALLRFLNVFQFLPHQQSFQSISNDPDLQRILPNIYTQIRQQHAYNFPVIQNRLTQNTTSRIDRFTHVLQRSPLRNLSRYFTKRTFDLWEQIGLLYQLLDHPLYKNVATSIPGTLVREVEILLVHLIHYNIRYKNIWCLQLYNSKNHKVKPLYPHKTVGFLGQINESIEHYWDTTTSDSLQTLHKGAIACQTSFSFIENTNGHKKETFVSIYPHEAITIGRWNTQKPPHLPLPLHPTLSERVARVTKDNIHIEPKYHTLVTHDCNTIRVYDNTIQFECTRCGLLQDGLNTTCVRQTCNSMLRKHQHTPLYTMAIAHNFKETYKNSITVKWNTSESATYCTATKWFAFEDEILVVIFKNRLGIISEEKPLQIVSKSKGVMSVESGTIYPLHDVYMLKTSTSTITIHCSNIY